MPTLRELITKISFQTDLKPLSNVSKAIEGIKSRLNLLIGVEAIKGLAALTDRFGNFALDLKNAAAAAGLTTDEFQKLSYAAAQSGISQETMGSTLKSLNKRLQDARLGSEQAALAFSYAGIQPEQLGSFRSAEDALYALGKSLNAIQDPVRRAASAQELLGEQGPRLLASLAASKGGFQELAQGADAAANVVGSKSLDASAKAEQALIGLKSQVSSTAAQMFSVLAPALTYAFKAVSKYRTANAAVLQANFKAWAKSAAYVLGAVSGVVVGLGHDFILLIQRINAWGKTSGVFALIGQGAKLVARSMMATLPVILALGQAIGQTFAAIFENMVRVSSAIKGAVTAIVDVLHEPVDVGRWQQAFSAMYRMVTELAKAPFSVIVSAMESLYSAADKLYQLFFSGAKLEDSYLGKWARALGFAAGQLGLKPLSDGGEPQPQQSQVISMPMADQGRSFDMMRGMAPSPMAQNTSTTQQSINAPITLNIQGDASSAPVLNAIKDGVSKHFDVIMRQAQASSTPGMAY